MQLVNLGMGKKNVDRWFVAVYALGTASLVYDGMLTGAKGAYLNLVTFIIAIGVLITLVSRRKEAPVELRSKRKRR